jgi:hypothetical protein
MKRAAAATATLVLFTLAAIPCVRAAVSSYGKGVSLEKATPISAVLERPAEFSGKEVLVKGLVVDVCAARGCWMELAGDKPSQKLRIKVEDGVMVFPLSARGRQAAVQGTVRMIRLCPDEAARFGGQAEALSLEATGALVE